MYSKNYFRKCAPNILKKEKCWQIVSNNFLDFVLFNFGKKNYLQSSTAKVEEWRLKQKDTEEWMNHRQLPPELQQRVRRFVQYKWLATRGVDEEAILRALPLDLRRQIQRHLCLDIVRRVSIYHLLIR